IRPLVCILSSYLVFIIADHRIQKFDSNGNFLTKWGSYGTGNGQFDKPTDLAFDSAGNLYVTEDRNHRVQKFDSNGAFLATWGSYGTGDGQFNHAYGIAIDKNDNIYIDDAGNNRIQLFTSSGSYLTQWGSQGSGNGQFQFPSGLALNRSSTLFYVSDNGNHRVQVFGVLPGLVVQPNGVSLANGDKINVPVTFTGNGATIASVGFALNYQESCLTFDDTDSDNNSIPDAITGLSTALVASISHQPAKTGGELEVALYDGEQPITPFSDGTLFTVQFTVKPACLPTAGAPTSVTINFAANPAATFGDPTGQDVTGATTGATIPLWAPNSAPTALSLDNSSVEENSAAGTTVGAFNTTDPDTGDSFTYSLVSGSGDSDNASFTLDGATLNTAAIFDYETKSSYTIRVRTTDGGGLFFEQSFTISVTDVDETPIAVDDLVDPRTTVFLGGQTGAIDVLANDVANGGVLQVASVTQPLNNGGSVTNNTTNVNYTAPNSSGSATFTYQATNGYATSASANVTVSYVANHARGDCNGNGGISAADFIGVVLEIFDATNTKYQNQPAWWLTHTGDFAGSPLGCDANNSRNGLDNSSASVTAADIICSVLIFFGHACGIGVQAANMAQAAHLAVADAQATVGATTTLTVTLNTGGNGIAAATFALGLDPAVLHFDTTDADEDGVPDAITLNTPPGMSRSVTWNPAAKRLEVAVFGMSLPLPTLTDGTLATVSIAVANDTSATSTPLALDLVSFSDADGNDLPFTEQDGTLTITGNTAPPKGLFLPLVVR
ncbi:MAG: cohesin domain-containing protein, partial [Caldilineaceae bacterium]